MKMIKMIDEKHISSFNHIIILNEYKISKEIMISNILNLKKKKYFKSLV